MIYGVLTVSVGVKAFRRGKGKPVRPTYPKGLVRRLKVHLRRKDVTIGGRFLDALMRTENALPTR